MVGTERNLYTPNDDFNYGKAEAGIGGRLSAIIAMEETTSEQDVASEPEKAAEAQAIGEAVVAFANTGKPYMGGLDYRDVVL